MNRRFSGDKRIGSHDAFLRNAVSQQSHALLFIIIFFINQILRRTVFSFFRTMTSKKFGIEDVGITKIGANREPKSISESEWKKVLPEEVYKVARQAGERGESKKTFHSVCSRNGETWQWRVRQLLRERTLRMSLLRSRTVQVRALTIITFHYDHSVRIQSSGPVVAGQRSRNPSAKTLISYGFRTVLTEWSAPKSVANRCEDQPLIVHSLIFQCNAHLGHVFNDGPKEKTGERYCINSVCMAFEKKD